MRFTSYFVVFFMFTLSEVYENFYTYICMCVYSTRNYYVFAYIHTYMYMCLCIKNKNIYFLFLGDCYFFAFCFDPCFYSLASWKGGLGYVCMYVSICACGHFAKAINLPKCFNKRDRNLILSLSSPPPPQPWTHMCWTVSGLKHGWNKWFISPHLGLVLTKAY